MRYEKLRSEKLRMALFLPLYFCLFYFTLQRVVLFFPRQIVPSRVDEAIAFDPRWTIVYQSLYLMLPLPLLAKTREQLRRYTRGFLLLTSISFLFFAALPIEGPRPDVFTSNALYRLLITYDRNLNAFPSLHAALTMYTFLFGVWLMPRFRVAGGIWTGLILYATMATKQHYFVDVLAGVVLAIGAAVVAWRYTPRVQTIEEGP